MYDRYNFLCKASMKKNYEICFYKTKYSMYQYGYTKHCDTF